PFLHAFGLGEALPDELARRVEHALQHEVGALGGGCGCVHDTNLTVGVCQFFGPAMIIQPTPNLSATMPKLLAKKVSISGCRTWPPCASALNMRAPSAGSLASSASEKPSNL